jgi:phage I-like protein
MSEHTSNIRRLTRALNASAGGAAGESVARAICLQLPVTEGVPEWIPFLPAPDAQGRIIGEDGRSWTIKDMRALAARVKRKLPIDINHSTELAAPKGFESPAAGWMLPSQFDVRADGSLWVKPEWTKRGLNALESRDYGFVSPTFDFDTRTGEIKRLVSVALVNDPNLTLPALNQRQTTDEENPMLEQLLAALGLAKDVTIETALNAINKLKGDLQTAINQRDTPSLDRFVPRADYDAAVTRATNAEQKLTQRAQTDLEAEADREIDAALKAGKITPATKDYHRAICLKDGGLAEFRKFVAAAPVIASDQVQRVSSAADPAAGALTDTQRAICAKAGISEEEFRKSRTAMQAA